MTDTGIFYGTGAAEGVPGAPSVTARCAIMPVSMAERMSASVPAFDWAGIL